MIKDCTRIVDSYRNHLRRTEYRKAIQSLRQLWSLGNAYIDQAAPWSLVNKDQAAAATVLKTSINLVRLFAAAAWPVIPSASEKVFDALGLSDDERTEGLSELVSLTGLKAGRKFTVPQHLFTRISNDDIDEWQRRFSGNRP